MGIPALRAAAGPAETVSPVKNKTARETLMRGFHKFSTLVANRSLNMLQMCHDFLFGDADSLGQVTRGESVGPQKFNDLLSYGLFMAVRFHIPVSFLYSRS